MVIRPSWTHPTLNAQKIEGRPTDGPPRDDARKTTTSWRLSSQVPLSHPPSRARLSLPHRRRPSPPLPLPLQVLPPHPPPVPHRLRPWVRALPLAGCESPRPPHLPWPARAIPRRPESSTATDGCSR